MVDNVHWLPETYGPDLVEYYKSLLQEPLPQRLLDLLAMLDEAARAEAAAPPQSQERQPAPAD